MSVTRSTKRYPSSGRLPADEIVSPAGPSVPFPPQEALLVERMPTGPNVWYEPKWDGFRGVFENDGGSLGLWSRNGRPLLRYFPELRPLGERMPPHSALDGEIVIEQDGRLEFDLMQLRLHPAESRIRKLSAETPAKFIAFDVLLWNGEPLHQRPLSERRAFRSEEHTSELQSPYDLVCRLLLEKKKTTFQTLTDFIVPLLRRRFDV